MSKFLATIAASALSFILFSSIACAEESPLRTQANKLEADGNYKEAFDLYQKQLTDIDDAQSFSDLQRAKRCLDQLQRVSELDGFLEKTITRHASNIPLLIEAGRIYSQEIPHYGRIIAGEFKRGNHEGNHAYANSMERDRTRSIQLFLQAIEQNADAHDEIYHAYLQLAEALTINRQGRSAWKLQKLTDLTSLPDNAPGSRWQRGGRNPQGAPVDAKGNPLYYEIPDSWDAAKNDGERWRFALDRSARIQASQKDRNLKKFANFLRSQFGVTTLASYGWFRSIKMDEQQGILQLHTLGENETVAKLATGVKRFTLPENQNFITIYRELSQRDEGSADDLIQIYLDRRQHPKAVTLLQSTLEQFPKSHSLKNRKKLLQQITGNWGRFEASNRAYPAGSEPAVNYVFRNADSVTLTVRPVDTESMVTNLWKYLEGNPLKLKWELTHWDNLAEQLINGDRKKYVGDEIARRVHTIKPHSQHWDKRAILSVPIKKSGVYLITALLENGVTSHTVVWMDSTVIVRKNVKEGVLFYVTDAITGKVLPSVKLEFFGYEQERRKKPGVIRKYDVLTKRITKTTGENGSVLLNLTSNYQWMVKANTSKGSAYLGFSRIRTSYRDSNQLVKTSAFGITDRPVYQPAQKVYGKFWRREARYDLGEVSTFAGQKYTVSIRDATGNEVLKDLPLTADSYGAVEYTHDLPEDAKLGRYSVQLRQNNNNVGSHTFRVEEYKKPEYEVLVDAPKDPVMLGESFKATIKANYYHGAPVTEATVKVKVMRSRHNDLWFPFGQWDWLYGSGYGWLDVERPWYPGWKSWGCFCPRPFWWGRGGEQPEIVLEQELKIGPDGSVKVEVETALAKAVHSDTDHRYSITAEVIDASRRSIVGSGSVIAARQAYQVSVWLNRGYARVGDPIQATVATRSADGKEVTTDGAFILYQITSKDGKVVEQEIQQWKTHTEGKRNGELKFQAGKAGQYRLAAIMTDTKGRQIEGAILFTIRGDGKADGNFQYSDLELIPDKRTYAKGETVNLLINTKRPNSTVLLSLYGGETYQWVHVQGQSTVVEIPVSQKDMPNFFVEAATVSDATLHTTVREIIVPPEKRILNVEVLPNEKRFKPRAKGSVKVRITDQHGEPVKGSLALTIYDKSLEYISGGSNISDIKEHFWKWRRHFRGGFSHSLTHHENNVLKKLDERMQTLGVFGNTSYGTLGDEGSGDDPFGGSRRMKKSMDAPMMLSAPSPMMETGRADALSSGGGSPPPSTSTSAPAVMIRKDFADLIKWVGSVETDDEGTAEVPVTFPDNLTTWKIKTWAMAHGTRVGEGSAEVITSKDLIIRLQAPRFFVEKDEVVLSAVVHNYLKTEQDASVSLELEGGTLTSTSPLTQKQTIEAGGETRIDWRCKVTQEGEAIVRMKVLTSDDSDAMEMTYPVYVHGILKQEAWSRVIAQDQESTSITVNVPAERRPEQTRLEIRYSPTIAGSIVDALPYLVEYPYGCTEQTLNRFVPTVITQKLIREMGIDLEEVRNKRANLNPQEIGDDKTRMAQWKRWQRNPVFNEKEVEKMTREGIERLAEMQLTNGGWGWFSGYGEHAYPHTTAVVVHGLIIAKANGASIPDGMLKNAINWLKNYEAQETESIRMWKKRKTDTKEHADARDALVRLVLAEADQENEPMLVYLFRDKNNLSVYAKSLAGMAHHLAKDTKKRDAIIRNIMQYLVYDDENQSAYLKLGNEGYWWSWYGSEIEAHAWFLKLLAAAQPKSKEAQGLVKYLVNNRKHATYWNSTRDTAYCIEAIADYMRASGESNPNATVTVSVDGKEIKTVKITKENLFSYDNKVVIAGDALGTGEHNITIKRTGDGPLYTNAYLTVFTKEDFIKKAGLEVKVDRAYYKLERIDASEDTAGTKGQVIEHKVEKYKRIPLQPGDMLVSGDLVEVELHIHSKNDYEYLMFNDWKPAGLEALDVRSGYTNNGMGAYMEVHHEKTSFFVRRLTRGEHSLKYRLRAEIPGSFSALPTQAEAMYAPELKANSDEMKIQVKDK